MKIPKIENEQQVIEDALQGDNSAIKHIKSHLQKWILEAGKDHAKIEAYRIAICALGIGKTSQVEQLEKSMMQFITEFKKFTTKIQFK